jgi:hypothetical protein
VLSQFPSQLMPNKIKGIIVLGKSLVEKGCNWFAGFSHGFSPNNQFPISYSILLNLIFHRRTSQSKPLISHFRLKNKATNCTNKLQ